jgi:hypothetical protein
MTTFKNTKANFKKSSEFTQILFAQGENKPNGDHWKVEENDEFELKLLQTPGITHLHTQNGTRFFGWM